MSPKIYRMRRRERRCYGEKIIAEVARVRKQFWRLTNFKKETKISLKFEICTYSNHKKQMFSDGWYAKN